MTPSAPGGRAESQAPPRDAGAPPPPRARALRPALRFALSLALTVGLSAYLLSNVSLVELGDWMARAHPPLLLVFVALSLAGLFARALRYRWLLPAGVAFTPVVLVTAARNFLVDLLPARIGSLSYVYLLTARIGVPLEPVVSSFALTFIYDLLAMALLISIALTLEFGAFEGAGTLAVLLAIFAAGSVAAFLLLAPMIRLAAAIAGRLPRPFPALSGRLEEIAIEVRAAGGPARTARLLALSFVIRVLKFGAYWALLLAVLHERDLGAAELPFWRVFLGIAGAELSATLPIHGIAGIGTYEAAWTIGFTRFGVDPEVAVLSGFATHLLSQAFDYSLGLVAVAVLLGRRWRSSTRSEETS